MKASVVTRLQRVAEVLSPAGEVIVIEQHACQQEATVEALATRQLGRPWRSADVLVISQQTDSCPPRLHVHEDQQILIHRRTD